MALKQTIGDANGSIKDLFQKQVEHEFENERLYLSMALWCSKNGYVETAKFFSEHALEERAHGMRFINFMIKQKMCVLTPYTTDIDRDFSDMKDVLIKSVAREVMTSKMISALHKRVLEDGKLEAEITQKFLGEQLEEEQLFLSILNLYDLCEGSKIDFEMEVGQIKGCGKYMIAEL